MPVPQGYQVVNTSGQQQPTCFQKLKLGFMMGAIIGGSTGVLLGSFGAWRYIRFFFFAFLTSDIK